MKHLEEQALDQYLAALRVALPTETQVNKWKTAVRAQVQKGAEFKASPFSFRLAWLQVAFSLGLGLAVGAHFFGAQRDSQVVAENYSQNDATPEYVRVKLN